MNLQSLWVRANELARTFNSETPQCEEFKQLLREFQDLQHQTDPNLQKIGRLAVIFKEHWSQRQWLNLLVPLERYLDRRLTDPEIIGFVPDEKLASTIKLPLVVVADHWRSAFNVGALFRLADGFGVSKIFLTGYTPTPAQPAVEKTAMGSIECTPWEHHESTLALIDTLKQQGYSVWAMETAPEAQTLGDAPLPSPLALVLGNERFGLDPKIIDACHGVIKVPLRGKKNSMNVANCFGIFAYEWCRQHAK
jgi:tRNA G18 (ribose-2'-O)-methylase SpoU